MAIQISTGLRNHVLVTGSLRSALAGGYIRIYSGTPPATADAALSGNTLLVQIGNGDSNTGLNLATSATNGVVQKAGAETWTGTNAATGTATFFRHVASTDTGALSTTEPRIQGSVGTIGTDMELNSTALTSGATQTLDFYQITLPTL
jgi:hypothetical protein